MKLVWALAALALLTGCTASNMGQEHRAGRGNRPHRHMVYSMTARLDLDRTVVRRGQPLRGVLTLINKTGRPVPYCNGYVSIGLAKPGLPYQPTVSAIGCVATAQRPTIARGTSHIRVRVDTRYQQCNPNGRPTPVAPRCLGASNNQRIPQLPPGTYQVVLIWRVSPTPAMTNPVSVRIAA